MTLEIVAETPPLREAGGSLRVGDTGVTLETVLWSFLKGSTPEDISDQFPSLRLADVYEVIAYYLRHRDEVERYLATRENCYRQTADRLARVTPTSTIQTRLDARRRP